MNYGQFVFRKRVLGVVTVLSFIVCYSVFLYGGKNNTNIFYLVGIPGILFVLLILLYGKCPHCRDYLPNKYDKFCPRCGKELKDTDRMG